MSLWWLWVPWKAWCERPIFFWRISIKYSRIIWPKMTKFSTMTRVGRGHVSWSATHTSQSVDPSVPKKFWDPYLCPFVLALSYQIWHGIKSGSGVFFGVSYTHIPKAGAQHPNFIEIPYLHPCGLRLPSTSRLSTNGQTWAVSCSHCCMPVNVIH